MVPKDCVCFVWCCGLGLMSVFVLCCVVNGSE